MPFELAGLAQLQTRLTEIQTRLANPRPGLEPLAFILADSAAKTFDQQGRPAWPKRVSDVHGNLRYADKQTHPVLDKTGALRDSVTDPRNYGWSLTRYVIGPRRSTLSFGTSIPYGKYHQSPAPRRKLPRRPFLAFFPEDIAAIVTTLRRFLWWGGVN